ncbi:beta-ketoacyl synthase N-terminal-like domain-containing protein [Kutzneria sp. NPDC052558]|uniref:beta-ketoacyl synthase N-terminal-like domain-containing protein n=1 Tax=Kutzneria sp. NPDC052558 TaxID=3364121 RepID=UPI0037C6A1EF
MVTQEPVAIIGMGVVLPGAANVGQYWQNLMAGTDAITDIPEHRRDPEFHGAPGTTPDRTHGRRGGFVADTVDFDPLAFGIPPADIAEMEPDQVTALAAAAAAIDDAGGSAALGDRAKVGVILGRGGYFSPGLVRFDQRVRTVRQITRTVRELLPSASSAMLDKIRDALLEPLGEFHTESATGLVPNLSASRVANRLDLGGPAYTVDAACASSLIAVDHAIAELARGRCDVVFAGGVHHCHDDTLWSMFTQIGALSPSQRISPLSRDADGLLIGEGTALLMLKRLADARRDGNRVYAVLRGSGISSDGRSGSLLSPSISGQVLALRRAWDAAGIDPRQAGAIGLLEAHGTATRAGDAAEIATMTEVFGAPDGRTGVVGSVKSMIGHTMPAAGAAGLVKVALALYHKVLPPTLHCDDPNPLLTGTRFRVIGEAEPWEGCDLPRRAAVNAFGFGGVNAHVVLEEGDAAGKRRVEVREPDRILRLSAESPAELVTLLDRPQQTDVLGSGRARIGIVNPTPDTLAVARRVAAKVAKDGQPQRGVKGIWCTVDPLLPDARTAFLFPGLEADVSPRCDDVARHFGLPTPAWSTETVLDHAESVTAVGRLVHTALGRLGITPDALAGHSVGEWTAMRIAGMFTPMPTADNIQRYWHGHFTAPELDYLMLGCSVVEASGLTAGLDVVISHDNAPHQTIACGPAEEVVRLAEVCREHGVIARTLPFRSGYHTPYLRPYLAPYAALADDLELHAPSVPVWSATSVAPFPTTHEAVRRLYLDHLLQRVRFRELIETMHANSFRVFLQLGAGQLGSFVTDTLGDANHLVIGAASNIHSGLDQLRRVATALWVEGANPKFEALAPRQVRLNSARPLLSLPSASRGILDVAPEIPPGLSDDIAVAYQELLDETRRSAAAVVAALTSDTVESTVDVSLASMPFLRDHRFFRQRPGWPDEADFWPVVPATTLIDIACRQVENAWGVTATGVRDAAFNRWLIAEPAKSVPITMRRAGDRVDVAIGTYASMTVCLGERPPGAHMPIPHQERPMPFTAAEVYSRRKMFHGPAFHGVTKLTGIGDHHLRGEITVTTAPGALLDNVGQLLGCWLQATYQDSLVAFPRSIAEVTWHAPEPGPGAVVDCQIEVTTPQPDILHMDATLSLGGRPLATIVGWQDIRFPCDSAMHDAYTHPESHYLSTVDPNGRAMVRDRWRSVAAREFFAGLYLNGAERAAFASCPPREQRGWLLRRIAIKDAVRARLAADGVTGVYPAEIFVHEDETTVSGVHGRILPELAVGAALDGDVAVGLIHPLPAVTRSAT